MSWYRKSQSDENDDLDVGGITRDMIWEETLAGVEARLRDIVGNSVRMTPEIGDCIRRGVVEGCDRGSWGELSLSTLEDWLERLGKNISTMGLMAEWKAEPFKDIEAELFSDDNSEEAEQDRYRFNVIKMLIDMGTVRDRDTFFDAMAAISNRMANGHHSHWPAYDMAIDVKSSLTRQPGKGKKASSLNRKAQENNNELMEDVMMDMTAIYIAERAARSYGNNVRMSHEMLKRVFDIYGLGINTMMYSKANTQVLILVTKEQDVKNSAMSALEALQHIPLITDVTLDHGKNYSRFTISFPSQVTVIMDGKKMITPGIDLSVGMEVMVLKPKAGDMHQNEFVGTITKITDGIVTVRDQEDNYFDVDADNVEAQE